MLPQINYLFPVSHSRSLSLKHTHTLAQSPSRPRHQSTFSSIHTGSLTSNTPQSHAAPFNMPAVHPAFRSIRSDRARHFIHMVLNWIADRHLLGMGPLLKPQSDAVFIRRYCPDVPRRVVHAIWVLHMTVYRIEQTDQIVRLLREPRLVGSVDMMLGIIYGEGVTETHLFAILWCLGVWNV